MKVAVLWLNGILKKEFKDYDWEKDEWNYSILDSIDR